jgi:hypothetical protein
LTGSIGLTGTIGITGQQGVFGLTGYEGITGPEGAGGNTGAQGVTGNQGETGVGIQGSTGLQGSTGMSGIGSAGGVTGMINITFNGNSNPVSTGEKTIINLPFNLQLDGWRFLTNATGSISVDMAISSYTNYPFTGPLMHAGSTGPYISAGIKNEDTDLSDWVNVTGAAGELIRVSVGSVTGISLAYLSLNYHQR